MNNCQPTEPLWTSPVNPQSGILPNTQDQMVLFTQNNVSAAFAALFTTIFTPLVVPAGFYLKIFGLSGRTETNTNASIVSTITPQGQGEHIFPTTHNVMDLSGSLLALICGQDSPYGASGLVNAALLCSEVAGNGSQISWPLIVPAGYQVNFIVPASAAGQKTRIDVTGILVKDIHYPENRGDL